MPGYGQNTQIPVNRGNRTQTPGGTSRSVYTPPPRPPTSAKPANPATSRYRQSNSTYTKSKPFGETNADETRPPGDSTETTVAPRPELGTVINPPLIASSTQGSYGQRYNALRQASTPTSGYSRPQPEYGRRKLSTSSPVSSARQSGKPLVSEMRSGKSYLPSRPTTATHPRSKKFCRRPFNPDEDEINAENVNSSKIDVSRAGTADYPSSAKVRKARSVSRHERRVNKRAVSRVTKSNGNSNQQSNDNTLHTSEVLEKEESLNAEGNKSKPSIAQLPDTASKKSQMQLQQGSKKSQMHLQRGLKKSTTKVQEDSRKKSELKLQGKSKSSMLQDESKMSMLKDGPDSSLLQLGSKTESDAAYQKPYDLHLTPEYGTSVHIDSDPGIMANHPALSLNHLRPEYTLKPPTLSSSPRHVENFDGISIEDMTPPAELHNVVSDPKLLPVQSTTPAESITEMKQPDLVGSASEESLPEDKSAPDSYITNANSNADSSAVSSGKITESDKVTPSPLDIYISPEEYSPETKTTLLEKLPENVESQSQVSSTTEEDNSPVDTASEIVPKQEELSTKETAPSAPLEAPEVNCYEIDPLEKYEYLGSLVHIPRQITLTKDSPPLYIGTFPVENTSHEDLIFKVKTKTHTASIYAITPKLGTLNKNSTIEVKVQADFSKGMAPSLDMTRNNMVVLLATAPNTRMTRKDLEKFWKLLQDQQEEGKSSFYIHSIENIQLADQAGNLLLKEKKSAGAVAKKPVVAVPEDPKPTCPIPEAAGDSDTTDSDGIISDTPLAAIAPSNIVNANNVISNDPSSMSSSVNTERTYEELYTTEVSHEITEDVRNMTGSMNSMLRWGSIAIYVSSLAGIVALIYHNFRDGAEPPSNGVMNALSSTNKEKR